MPSRLLPPWLDTEIAVDAGVDGPQGVVDAADALEHERLPAELPHCSRSQATSSQDGGGVVIHS